MNRSNDKSWHANDARREIERLWPVVDYSDLMLLTFIIAIGVTCAITLFIASRKKHKRNPARSILTYGQRFDPNREWMERLRW